MKCLSLSQKHHHVTNFIEPIKTLLMDAAGAAGVELLIWRFAAIYNRSRRQRQTLSWHFIISAVWKLHGASLHKFTTLFMVWTRRVNSWREKNLFVFGEVNCGEDDRITFQRRAERFHSASVKVLLYEMFSSGDISQ